MIDSHIMALPYSDNSKSFVRDIGCCSRSASRGRKRSCGDKSPHCKKRKKLHKWSKRTRSRERAKLKCKLKKRIRTKPEAPFNSTQFIMEEHDVLNESDLSTNRPRRHRDSSLSMESEDFDDDFYLSPEEDEEEKNFMTRQFWCAYEDYNAERLYSMNKNELIKEYFGLEERLTQLEKELQETREEDRRRIREPSPVDDDDEEEIVPGEVPVDAETAAKIEIFRNEIQKLEVENKELMKQNLLLRRKHSCRRCDTIDLSEDLPASDSDSGDTGFLLPSTSSARITEQELEISESRTPLRCDGDSDVGAVDSGIASSEGAASSASSGEDGKEKDEKKPKVTVSSTDT